MLIPWARRTLALVLVVGALGSLTANEASARRRTGAVEPPEKLLVPDPLPEGWFVRRATVVEPDYEPRPIALYSADGSGDPSAPAVVLWNVDDEGDGNLIHESERTVDGPGGPNTAKLWRNGDFVWVIFPSPMSEAYSAVVARGLTDKQATAAARAVRFQKDGSARFEGDALPAELERAGNAAVSADSAYAGEQIDLVHADGTERVGIEIYRARGGAAALQRFWLQQLPLRREGMLGVMREEDGNVIVVTGDQPVAFLRAIARSVQPVGDAQWQAFRNRVLELPPAAILAVEAGDEVVIIGGRGRGVVWAAGYVPSAGQIPGVLYTALTADDAVIGASGLGTVAADRGLPTHIVNVAGGCHGGADTVGAFSFVQTPVTVVRMEFLPSVGDPVAGVAAPMPTDPDHHYFAAFVRDTCAVEATAYDAAGQVVEHRNEVGCNTCRE